MPSSEVTFIPSVVTWFPVSRWDWERHLGSACGCPGAQGPSGTSQAPWAAATPSPSCAEGRGPVPAPAVGDSSVLRGVAAVWGWQQLPGLLVPWKAEVMQPPRGLSGSLWGEERNKPLCRWAVSTGHCSLFRLWCLATGRWWGCGFCSSLCGFPNARQRGGMLGQS